MPSLYDELAEKLARDPRITKHSGARVDLGLLMFNARDDVRDLWVAAQAAVSAAPQGSLGELEAAVEKLRPLFGDRDRA